MKIIGILLWLSITACHAQQKQKNMTEQNPLLCDIETGMCEIPEHASHGKTQQISKEKTLKIIYFTDPICSSCWGIEPQLRKLKLAYGDHFAIEYRMGGLLPDWSYNSGGISGPKDVAKHWDEVSVYYDMPIDGDVWLEDPLSSSFPPSIAFKAAQMQDEKKAIDFLRKMREYLFLEKKNIEKWEIVEKVAIETGLNPVQLKKDYESKAVQLFQNDLALAKQMGVRGFPSIFITNGTETEFIYGSKPYLVYEGAILKIASNLEKKNYPTNWEFLFSIYPTLTAKEFSVLADMERNAAEKLLIQLVQDKKLQQIRTKNGNLYIK